MAPAPTPSEAPATTPPGAPATDGGPPPAEAGLRTRDAAPERTRGIRTGLSLSTSSALPAPLPAVELGYERDRFGARLAVPPLLPIGRLALSTSYAIDTGRRTRLHAAIGADLFVFSAYEFVGVGVERRLGSRRRWFARLDALFGDVTGWNEREGDRAALGLSVGTGRP